MELTFSDESVGYQNGQHDMVLVAYLDGEMVGSLDYSVYLGIPHIKMLEVKKDFRRMGIGTKLLKQLQNMFPEEEIDLGMLTPDGTKLMQTIKRDFQENPSYRETKERYEDVRSEIQRIMAKIDRKDYSEANKLNDLHDEEYELEQLLSDMKTGKYFIKEDELMSEDYPQDFDWEYFKSLRNLKDIVKYATSKLGRPKKGTSRLTYLIDDDKVLKVAFNQVGLRQNRIESDYYIKGYYDVVAEVLEKSPQNIWVEMERVKPLRNDSLIRKYLDGYSLYELKIYLNQYGLAKAGDNKQEKIFEKLRDNEFVNQIEDLKNSYGLLIGDLTKTQAWGMVKRDGKEVPVLFDYGLSEKDFKEYYQYGDVKKQYRSKNFKVED